LLADEGVLAAFVNGAHAAAAEQGDDFVLREKAGGFGDRGRGPAAGTSGGHAHALGGAGEHFIGPQRLDGGGERGGSGGRPVGVAGAEERGDLAAGIGGIERGVGDEGAEECALAGAEVEHRLARGAAAAAGASGGGGVAVVVAGLEAGEGDELGEQSVLAAGGVLLVERGGGELDDGERPAALEDGGGGARGFIGVAAFGPGEIEREGRGAGEGVALVAETVGRIEKPPYD